MADGGDSGRSPRDIVDAVSVFWQARYGRLLAELAATPRPAPSLFRSFFLGGFECSSHRRAHDRARVDVIAATGHDARAAGDYRLLRQHGIRTVRDGLRWHLIGKDPGRLDWSSLDPMLDAARETDTQVIWDLLHYGWPDWLDIWSADFVARFTDFCVAAAERIGTRTEGRRFYAPVNEISFFAWSGGDVAYINPFARGRADELKRQLARAAASAMAAIRAIDAQACFVHAEPVIQLAATDPRALYEAESYNRSQFDALDMIAGRRAPELGGRADYLDLAGVNYYHGNQWVHVGEGLPRGERLYHGDPLYKPFRYLLMDSYAHFGRPIFVAETGTEGEARTGWLAYMCEEVRAAMRAGVPVEGICLYPVLNHPGWDDERNCPNGLIEFAGADGPRTVYRPLADELARQQALFRSEFGIGA